MLKKMINTHYILKLYLLILTTVFLTQFNLSESSFAQNSNGNFDLKTTSPENSEKTMTKPTLVTQKSATPETATAVPDVTSNISLIITPDIVNPLANEDPTSSNAISKIPTAVNTTTNEVKDKVPTNDNQNNKDNTNDSDVITPSNTNTADSKNYAITTPTTAAANNATSGQGNSSSSSGTSAAAAAANNATSGQGNSSSSSGTSAAAAAANNGSQITSNMSQGTNNNTTPNKSINSSDSSEGQIPSPTGFSWFDEFFKYFGAK